MNSLTHAILTMDAQLSVSMFLGALFAVFSLALIGAVAYAVRAWWRR